MRHIGWRLIHPTSENRNSRKFANNNALKGEKFIGNSSPLASVGALVNFRRG
jgi:hypothetical protein